LTVAKANHGEDPVSDSLLPRIAGLTHLTIREDFSNWELNCELSAAELKTIVANVAKNKKWFKEQRYGREIGPIVWNIISENHQAPLTGALLHLEAWAYA